MWAITKEQFEKVYSQLSNYLCIDNNGVKVEYYILNNRQFTQEIVLRKYHEPESYLINNKYVNMI